MAGLCFAISQFVFSNYHGPTLPDIMSAIITLVGLVILLRFWKPATIWRFEGEKPTVLTGKGYSFGEVIRAWIPFIILAVMVFFWGLPPVQGVPRRHQRQHRHQGLRVAHA